MVILSITPWLPTYMGQSLIRCNTSSRRLNYLFCFSAQAVSDDGEFKKFSSAPSNVVLSMHGKTYHRTLDIAHGEHPMRWFLYDEQERTRRAVEQKIPQNLCNTIQETLLQYNPYIENYCSLASQPSNDTYVLELKYAPSSGGELAAIVPYSQYQRNPRSVYIFRNDPCNIAGHFVNILSPHYEPLQYL